MNYLRTSVLQKRNTNEETVHLVNGEESRIHTDTRFPLSQRSFEKLEQERIYLIYSGNNYKNLQQDRLIDPVTFSSGIDFDPVENRFRRSRQSLPYRSRKSLPYRSRKSIPEIDS